MSTGNCLLCRRLEAVLLEPDRIKGETTQQEWIWAEQEAGPRGPHTWGRRDQQSLSQHSAQLQSSVTSTKLSAPMAAAPGAATEPHFWANSWRGSQTPGLDTSDFCVGACGRGRFIKTCLTWTLKELNFS